MQVSGAKLKHPFQSNPIKQKSLCMVLRLLYNYFYIFSIHYHGEMNLCNQHLFRHGVLSVLGANVTKLNKKHLLLILVQWERHLGS